MNSTKAKARLIVPLWGAVYAQKLVTITLPAALAPGNLPSICQMFDVELVLVTESKLYASIRASRAFQAVSKLCATKFIAIDDLLTDLPGDYGVVLTYALYRGFQDLGERMTETYLLFLNADFIISDGSLRHLGQLMLEGKRVIHAPSFRAILEEVWPRLEARVDAAHATLSISARDMARLALTNKHITVRARTVNQRLCHQWRMDQFYWQIDENTLIGYQWPVALVAIKPERVVTEPTLVWDYGFIPEAAPTAPRHFISDSDNFFMLEPQKRSTGEDLVRLGWISVEDIARDLSKWTTKDQRACGEQLLIIHSGELPAGVDTVVAESRKYMAQIYSHLDPTPQPHIGHGLLGPWFDGAKERMRGQRQPVVAHESPLPSIDRRNRPRAINPVLDILRTVYGWTFGRLPAVNKPHPLWGDTHAIVAKLESWKSAGGKVLWLSSGDSLFHRLLEGRVDPISLALLQNDLSGQREQFDACFCELTFDELTKLRAIYAHVRPLMKDGSEIVVYVFNKHLRTIEANDIDFCENVLPDLDLSKINFHGSRLSATMRSLYLQASGSLPGRPLVRALATAAALVGLAPIVWLANRRLAGRDPEIFTPRWTSLTMDFKVRRPAPAVPERIVRNVAS